MNSARPGRQKLEMDILYVENLLKCPKCFKKFKYFFEFNQHLISDHKLIYGDREAIYKDMGISWFQNYEPAGWWKGMWIE